MGLMFSYCVKHGSMSGVLDTLLQCWWSGVPGMGLSSEVPAMTFIDGLLHGPNLQAGQNGTAHLVLWGELPVPVNEKP